MTIGEWLLRWRRGGRRPLRTFWDMEMFYRLEGEAPQVIIIDCTFQ